MMVTLVEKYIIKMIVLTLVICMLSISRYEMGNFRKRFSN